MQLVKTDQASSQSQQLSLDPDRLVASNDYRADELIHQRMSDEKQEDQRLLIVAHDSAA